MDFRLSQINIYPIKSLGGIALEKAVVEERGLQHDRRWMLVDEQGLFMSQRTFAAMALLQVELVTGGLQVRHKQHAGLPPFHIPFEPECGNPLTVQVWDDSCQALEVSAEANTWFSEALNRNCRLVYMPEESRRQVDLEYARPGEITSFSDAFPLLMIGEASLANLNSKLSQPLPMNRFRPNLVFSGGPPFAEDTWRDFSIGAASFKAVKPCARCVMTTIDQQTAQKSPEPLRTLGTYRQQGHKILFGQNVLPLKPGHSLALGDQITIL
ncbi:MAG: MOSC domain-containing protein [Adhaeribacter sp.]